jgi:hypothetical protein
MIRQITGKNLKDLIDRLPQNCVAIMAVRDNGVWTLTYELIH